MYRTEQNRTEQNRTEQNRTERQVNYKKISFILLILLAINSLGFIVIWHHGNYTQKLENKIKNYMNPERYNYTEYYTEDFRLFSNNNLLTNNSISGKKINFIGDSYMANNIESVEKSWQYKFCVRYGCLYRNYGLNGNPMVAETKDRGIPVVNRYTDMDKDTEIIIVIAGKNDYNVQLPITEFQKGVSKLCVGLKKDFPNSKIVFFTPWKIAKNSVEDIKTIKLQEYCDCIVNICNQNSIPVFDVTRNSDIYMYDSDFRAEYCLGPNDVSHLNSNGHNRFLPQAEKFLLSCIK